MKLSILVASLHNRSMLLKRLKGILERQLAGNEDVVELIVVQDDGTATIGEKRNILLSKSQGDYVCFIDDDDLVSPKYVALILEALSVKPDCVGMEGIIYESNIVVKKFYHSIKYRQWTSDGKAYFRNPNHLNPVRSDIAKEVGFPKINKGEDRFYSEHILSELHKEVVIPVPIYYYFPGCSFTQPVNY